MRRYYISTCGSFVAIAGPTFSTAVSLRTGDILSHNVYCVIDLPSVIDPPGAPPPPKPANTTMSPPSAFPKFGIANVEWREVTQHEYGAAWRQ